MPTVSYTDQAFLIDGRRLWLVAASMQYARIAPESWADRIADARQAGFNAIETAVPWLLHEPRPGRFDFEGRADVAEFVRACHEQGMMVMLRVGPYVGEHFDGGGLPPWLWEHERLASRGADPQYLDRVALWLRSLFEQVAPLLATGEDGPIITVQVEHRWHCGNEAVAERTLGEFVRIARESGIDVPILNANDLWTEPYGTLDTWQGNDDLLANLRQLRTLRPDHPRIVSRFEVAGPATWEGGPREPMDPAEALHGLASILAAGAQPVVAPFHGGTNYGRLAGRVGPGNLGTTTHAAACHAPVGESGERGPLFHAIRRLTSFASHFGHVLADVSGDAHPTVIDPPKPEAGRGTPTVSVVPLRGSLGRIVFVFADRPGATSTLLLDDGRRLPVELGDQSIGWFAIDVDLGGRAKLDYTNACPMMLVDRSILVLVGTAGREVMVSVGDTPVTFKVPTGRTPEVQEVQGITVVVVSHALANETFATDDTVYVGVSGLDVDGEPCMSSRGGSATAVRAEGDVSSVKASAMHDAIPTTGAAASGKKSKSARGPAAPTTIKLPDWQAAPAGDRVDGTAARFARIAGPATLPACGASAGIGWYRAAWRSGGARTRTVLPMAAGHRMHLWMNGTHVTTFGTGPGASPEPFSLAIGRGDQMLTAYVDTFGRPSSGNDLDRAAGLHGQIVAVKKIGPNKPKSVEREPVDPFEVRGFVEGAVPGAGASQQYSWAFAHAKKTPVLVHITDAATPGVFLVNDHPVHVYAGASGFGWETILLDPEWEFFKRGKNELRFAPLESDHGDGGKDVAASLKLYEIADDLTERAEWAFCKFERPADADFHDVDAAAIKKLGGRPCWWRTNFDAPDGTAPLRVDVSPMSIGAVVVNGQLLGRVANAAAGSGASPQQTLLIPRSWLSPEGNELAIFDETGASPSGVTLRVGGAGELDG